MNVFAKMVSIQVTRDAVRTVLYSYWSHCSHLLVPITNKLELGQPCNNSIEWVVAANNETNLVCDLNCNRARCAPGYQPKESTCGKQKETNSFERKSMLSTLAALALGSDRCVYREDACKIIDANSICDRDENQCLCAPSFYLAENHQCGKKERHLTFFSTLSSRSCLLARAVDSVCATDEDCGGSMSCEGQRCKCSSKQRAEATTDIYSRPITRCFNNGTKRMSLILGCKVIISFLFRCGSTSIQCDARCSLGLFPSIPSLNNLRREHPLFSDMMNISAKNIRKVVTRLFPREWSNTFLTLVVCFSLSLFICFDRSCILSGVTFSFR